MRAATWMVSASVGLLGAAACGDDGGTSTASSASAGGDAQVGVGSTGASSADGGNGPGSGGGSGATSAANTTGTTGPSSVVATTGAGGSMAFVCDPPAAPGSLFENEAEALDVTMLEPVSMCQFRGDVLLIVNTAAI